MLLLPGGEFLMGSDSGDLDERPRHAVRLLPFLLDETPITRRQSCSGPNISLPGWMPALFIRISVPPNRSRTAISSPDTSSMRLTSSGRAT